VKSSSASTEQLRGGGNIGGKRSASGGKVRYGGKTNNKKKGKYSRCLGLTDSLESAGDEKNGETLTEKRSAPKCTNQKRTFLGGGLPPKSWKKQLQPQNKTNTKGRCCPPNLRQVSNPSGREGRRKNESNRTVCACTGVEREGGILLLSVGDHRSLVHGVSAKRKKVGPGGQPN